MSVKCAVVVFIMMLPFFSEARFISCVGNDGSYAPETFVQITGQLEAQSGFGKTVFVGPVTFKITEDNGQIFTETLLLATDFLYETRVVHAEKQKKNNFGNRQLVVDQLFLKNKISYHPNNFGGLDLFVTCSL